MHKVLVVDDDKVLQQSVKQALEYHHFNVDVADNGKQAVGAVYREKYDLVVMDVNMPEMDGLEALMEIKKHDSSIIVLILTAYSNVSDAVKAVKEGAFNYLEKPITSDNLVALIKRALKARSMVETTAFSAPTLSLGDDADDKFVGESNSMQKVFDVITKLAKVNTPVLIRGESGTGKELVAKAIHYNGPRKDNKFVAINCGAISENLIESELFGHEKGAFTGADSRKIGKFQFAEGGTLFLDELGDMPVLMQVKLLRVLQEKKFTPVGANREVPTNVRIIAATNRPLEKMIEEGTFREDLFYRLNVIPIFLNKDDLRKKIMKIKTDSKTPGEPKETENSSIFSIYRAFAPEDQTRKFQDLYKEGISWGEAKELLFELLKNQIQPFRQEYKELIKDKSALEKILLLGAEKALDISTPIINKVRKAVGIRAFGD